MDTTMSGRYGDIEFRAVCSASDRNASRSSCRTGNGVSSLSSSEAVELASDGGDGCSRGVFGGVVGKVW